jgi:hypothetical protein
MPRLHFLNGLFARSLKTRRWINIWSVGAIIMVVTLLIAYMLYHHNSMMELNTNHQVVSQRTLQLEQVLAALPLQDKEQLLIQLLQKGVPHDPSIISVHVASPSGEILYHYQNLALAHHAGNHPSQPQSIDVDGAPIAEIRMELTLDNNELHLLYLAMSGTIVGALLLLMLFIYWLCLR